MVRRRQGLAVAAPWFLLLVSWFATLAVVPPVLCDGSSTANTSEELHAALADPNVTEVLVGSRLQLSASVFGASPERQLVLHREVVIRGVSPEAGLWCNQDKDSLEQGWLRYSDFLTFESLFLDNLILMSPESTLRLLRLGIGSLIDIRGADRLQHSIDDGVPDGAITGVLSIRNCSVKINVLGAYVDAGGVSHMPPFTGDVASALYNPMGFAGMSTMWKWFDPEDKSWQVPVVSPSEANLATLETIRLMLIRAFQGNVGVMAKTSPKDGYMMVWGLKNIHVLWIWLYGFRIVDTSISWVDGVNPTFAKDVIEFEYSSNADGSSPTSDDLDAFREASLPYQGEKSSTCQSIYAQDTALLTAATEAGINLPPTYRRLIGGRDYTGDINVTVTGRPCLPWRDIKHHGAAEDFGAIEGNACRNPSAFPGQRGVWCFVDSIGDTFRAGFTNEQDVSFDSWHGGREAWAQYEWEYCDVPSCGDEEAEEPLSCLTEEEKAEGHVMRGGPWSIGVTLDGKECHNWADMTPHQSLFGRFNDTLCRAPDIFEGLEAGGVLRWPSQRELMDQYLGLWCFADKDYMPAPCDARALEVCSGKPAGMGTFPVNISELAAGVAGSEEESADPKSISLPVVLGIAISASVVVVLLPLSIAVWYLRRKRNRDAILKSVGLEEDRPVKEGRLSIAYSDSGKSNGTVASSTPTLTGHSSSSDEGKHIFGAHAVRVLSEDPDKLGMVELHGCVGSGISSRVERCTWHGNAAACKIMNIDQMPEKVAQKIVVGVEANLLVGLCHPHVVQTFQIYHVTDASSIDPGSIGEPGQNHKLKSIWLVQEYCGAGSVASIYEDLIGRPDAMAVKVTILRQVTLALRFLHCEMHLVHGDLKPANVLLRRFEDGNLIAKVADFGLAHVMQDRKAYEANSVCGDLYYQPPESMFRGLISPAMDIWALGVFAYEIITGGISAVTLKYHLQRVQEGFKAELPPDAPPRLQALVYACTSPEPDDRPTADQALQEIDLIMKEMGLMQNPAPETESVTAGQGSLKIPNAQYQRVVERLRQAREAVGREGYTLVHSTGTGGNSRLLPYKYTRPENKSGYVRTQGSGNSAGEGPAAFMRDSETSYTTLSRTSTSSSCTDTSFGEANRYIVPVFGEPA